MTDQGDEAVAKRKAEDAITTYPEMDCMVGLFAYNPPACLEAVRSAGRLGQVKIVGFDEDRTTVQAIAAGEIYGTVTQNPYDYGAESVKLLGALIAGDESGIPADKVMRVPYLVWRKDNVAELSDLLDRVLGTQR